MGLFDKKFCDICGGKIGMLGNRKLDDGNCCKDCAKQLSPFFSERRRSTVADIKEQLAYREQNKAAVAAFNTTRTLGLVTKVFLDEDAGKFAVSGAKRLADENADIMDFSQVTGCNIEVQESSKEVKRKTPDGKEISFVPPKFSYSFTHYVIIHVNSPWFNEIKFPISKSVEVETTGARNMMANTAEIGRRSNEYRQAEALGNEIKTALTKVRQNVRAEVAAANAPKVAQTCPQCSATCVPDAQGCCEYCGGAMLA